jgi:hypothetical protein
VHECDRRTEVIHGVSIHAWSRRRWDADTSKRRGNEYEVAIRDQAIVYLTSSYEPVTSWERDTFVGMLAVMRATASVRNGNAVGWPFYGMGITDAGPSPYGWLWD